MFHKNHFLVVGANSKTGIALSDFLSTHNAQYSISDTIPNYYNTPIKNNHPLNKDEEIHSDPLFVYDSKLQTEEQLKGVTHIILSPGVPRSLDFLQSAKQRQIPIDSEIAFTYSYLKSINQLPFMIGITGSNGKSTTSYLLFLMLKQGYKKGNVYLLGNFGTPFITEADQLNVNDVVVLELSSYQLEDGEKYHLNASTIINISENHLDRYDSFLDYQKAKEKIFLNQTPEDFVIINESSPLKSHFNNLSIAQKVLVDINYNKEALFSISQEGICFKGNLFASKKEIILNQNHMLENMLTAAAFAYKMEVSLDIIKKNLIEFKGLEHRSEFVIKKDDILIINDSKATTPYAVKPNLTGAFKNIVLILGGKNKNLDFTELSSFFQEVSFIVFYGFSGKEIQEQLHFDETKSVFIYNFDEAITKAFEIAKKIAPSTLLLSPGCTSFDQFKSFEERGKHFKKLIYDFK